MKSLRTGWRAFTKKRFHHFFARREDLSKTPDGFQCLNHRTIIPPTLRRAVIDDLHSSHLGVEKMKSLVRLTAWWSELDADLARHAKNCQQCFQKKPKQPSKWSSWSMASEPWQRLHANYCGTFLRDYYALVGVGAFSKWPEVFITKPATADFTLKALRKTFSREGVSAADVTDNGRHVSA